MASLPNPFEFGVSPVAPSVVAASSPPVSTDDAAADISMHELIARGFSPSAFLNDLEPLPAFISAPSQAYLRAAEIAKVLRVIAGN